MAAKNSIRTSMEDRLWLKQTIAPRTDPSEEPDASTSTPPKNAIASTTLRLRY